MKNIKLLGLGSLLSIASIGATLPFVVACGSNQENDDQIAKINNLLLNQEKEIKKLSDKLNSLETQIDELGELLKKTTKVNENTFDLLVAEYNKIKNNTNLVKDLSGQSIKIKELTKSDLEKNVNYGVNMKKIVDAITEYKGKLETNSANLSAKIKSLSLEVNQLKQDKEKLEKEISSGKQKIDDIAEKIQKIIDDYNKVFNIKTENK